jgi:arginine deiminase
LTPKIKADKVIPVKMPKNLLAIGYSRDQSLTLYKDPIILNMVLERRGEETVLNEIYYKMGIPPPVRSRWSLIGQNFVKIKIEGGNIFVIRTEKGVILLTGIGERGTNWAGLKFFSDILPREIRIIGVPLSSYIKDWFTSAFHLDLAFSFLGNTKKGMMALIDPEKIGLSSSIELDRKTGLFKLVNLLEVFKDNRVFVDEPPKEGQSKITAMNAFNLGNQKVMSDYLNKKVNDYIEKNFGIQVLRVKIPQLEAGGGGIRCSTREYWD